MTARLILFAPRGVPCERSEEQPSRTKCGQQIGSSAREITEAQAIVFCGDQRCVRCAPARETAKQQLAVRYRRSS